CSQIPSTVRLLMVKSLSVLNIPDQNSSRILMVVIYGTSPRISMGLFWFTLSVSHKTTSPSGNKTTSREPPPLPWLQAVLVGGASVEAMAARKVHTSTGYCVLFSSK